MAAPVFEGAGTGALWQSGGGTTVSKAVTIGNVVVFHCFVDGVGGATITLASHSGVEALDGTDNALTKATTVADVGSGTEFHEVYIGRAIGSTVSVVMSQAGGVDLYARWHEFSSVGLGTTLAAVIENGTAGAVVEGTGAVSPISDTGVTTLGPDRLALNLIAVNNDNQASFDTEAFTGQSGGTWVSGGSYGSATGTDGAIGLQYANMAAAGTINGGSLTMADANWGVVGFALIGTTVATTFVPRIAILMDGS
jgi:hypothetical protein